MPDIEKIIFIDKDGTTRAPMAAEIFKSYRPDMADMVEAKGIFVSFPEPMNQKAEAVMASDGLVLKDFSSSRISDSDITDRTLILTVDAASRNAVLESLSNSSEANTYTLNEYVGEELDVMNPYGGTLQAYGICYESLKNIVKKLIEIMEKGQD